jgi:mono/diheme cytochrome c family protein
MVEETIFGSSGPPGPIQESDERMTCNRRSLVSLAALLLLVACGGGRETGTPATGSHDTSAAVADTDALPQAQPDTVTASRDTATSVARTPAARPAPEAAPTPKPVAPKKPAPATRPAPLSDTVTAPAAPADTARPVTAPTDTTASAGNAPLRDPYHQAPRDTVSAEVYDGWKQFNLNCARCHGEDVLGTTIAPHLLVSVRAGGPMDTKEAFVQIVCAGRPEKGMPSWCALGMEMDKINAIYSYVKGRSEGKIAPGRPARKE